MLFFYFLHTPNINNEHSTFKINTIRKVLDPKSFSAVNNILTLKKHQHQEQGEADIRLHVGTPGMTNKRYTLDKNVIKYVKEKRKGGERESLQDPVRKIQRGS